MMLAFSSCLPQVERSLVELLSFARAQGGNGKVFVSVTSVLGSGLVLSLNGAEDLSVSADGEYSFTRTLRASETYEVTVKTQPNSPIQNCVVTGGSGTYVSGEVRSVLVNCGSALYALSGTISGLLGSGLTLANGNDRQTISANGSFSFTTAYAAGTAYSVTVATAPIHPSQSCVITNGQGTMPSSNVTNISITCTTTGYAIRATVSGIASGSLTLTNNASDNLVIGGNGSFVFPTDVNIGSTYSVLVTSAPSGHTCALTGNTGTIAAADVNITVNCFTLLATSPANLSVLQPNQNIVFQFSAPITIVSCSLGTGNLTTGGTQSFAVSTINITNDTLVLSTSTTWNPASVVQQINCTSAAGNALAAGTYTFRFVIPSTVSYVSQASGNDVNAGTTPATSVRTIQRGIAVLGACGTPPCVVYVEDGTYEANDFGQDFITVVNGISLYGGYTAGSSFATRNAGARQTIVRNTSPPASCTGATFPNTACRTILVPNTVTNITFIDGFRIEGASHSSETVGIAVAGGRPIISNNTIVGGAATASAAVLLFNFGGSSIADTTQGAFTQNTVTGGSCTAGNCVTAGVAYFATTASLFPFVQLSTITGGTCSTIGCKSYAFYMPTGNNTDLTAIRFNTFTGGSITTSVASSESAGFYVGSNTTTGKVYGNQINGGSAETSMGVYLNTTTLPLFIGDDVSRTGNSIYGGVASSSTYGIRSNQSGNFFSNSVHGGNVSSSTTGISYGIFVGSGVVALNGNRIYGGTSTCSGGSACASYGVFFTNLGSGSNLVRNHISAGQSSNTGSSNAYTAGMFLNQVNNTPVSIFNNMVDGGSSSVAISANTAQSYGVTLSNNTILTGVYYNTLYSGTAEDISAPLHYESTASRFGDIQNNILYTQVGASTRICLDHKGTTENTNLTTLRGNVFFGCPILVRFPSIQANSICAGGVVSDGACATTNISTPSTLNVYVDPVLAALSTSYGMLYRYFTSASPCSATRIANTLANPTTDAFGNARPGSDTFVSAGPLEYNGTCQ
ncbi:hypothetical protein LPTSP4_31590 [Leptospira ryugenii]|uniref:Uncharacterized protein n=2 Tax=Leptospira ryugenii TaxID=1917863 RepID=A0A2P2E417_9LEPT|nr:hypothetical protein LPTSP4_31590 [Leptospira ryugenii]